jgi:hypothetical protein
LESLCQEFCSSLTNVANDCNRGMTDVGMDDVCSSDDACEVPPNIPCETEIADLFECVIDNLAAICSINDQGNGNDAALPPQQVSPCQDVSTRFSACAEANGLDDDNTDDDDDTTRGCFAAGGCECDDPCTKCTCEANGDAEQGAACFDAGAACDLAAP